MKKIFFIFILAFFAIAEPFYIYADGDDSPPVLLIPGSSTGGTGTGGNSGGTGNNNGGTGNNNGGTGNSGGSGENGGRNHSPSRNFIYCYYDEGEVWFESYLGIDEMDVTIQNTEVGYLYFPGVALGEPLTVPASNEPYYIECEASNGTTYSGYLSTASSFQD